MRPAHVVEIKTPKGVVLNGLWFGPKRPKYAIVWVHGLGSSAFSKLAIVEKLVDKHTAVLTFNNRGHDKIASGISGKSKTFLFGSAHEIFTDSADDIQGAINCAKKNGSKRIYLAGHSTGCQKSAYWASEKKDLSVKGVILLAPISDYAGMIMDKGSVRIERADSISRSFIRSGKKHALLPEDVWDEPIDAQRFISLYSGESEEEIFTYWDNEQNPKTLGVIKLPLLVILAQRDEYADRPATQIQDWFAQHLKRGDEIAIVKNAPHGFQGAETRVASGIKKWILGHKSV